MNPLHKLFLPTRSLDYAIGLADMLTPELWAAIDSVDTELYVACYTAIAGPIEEHIEQVTWVWSCSEWRL